MYGNSRQMPGGKPTQERKAELKRASKVGQIIGSVKQKERPMFSKQNIPFRKDEEWKWPTRKGGRRRRNGLYKRTLWRLPDGRFAKRPELGERARLLGLTK